MIGKLSEQYCIGKYASVGVDGDTLKCMPLVAAGGECSRQVAKRRVLGSDTLPDLAIAGSNPARQHQLAGRTGTYSIQTCQHLKNALSAIFEHAKRNRMYSWLADQIGMIAGDRMAMNEHATLRMTERYTLVDLERRR